MDQKLKADLHLHTNFSDGAHTPAEILQMAVKKNLSVISITDHDTIEGLLVALDMVHEYPLEIIPGVELSTYYQDHEIHLLGYLFDIEYPEFRKLLNKLYDGRLHRATRICKRLSILGYTISVDEVLEISGVSAVGRPHIASAIVKKGYAPNIHKAFQKFLMHDSPAYVPKENLSVFEGINAINEAGGLSFIAHPGNFDEKLFKILIKRGLNGLEVIHPSIKSKQTRELIKFTKLHNILQSGGSDFHGGKRNDKRNFGVYHVSSNHVEKMKEFSGNPNN